MSYKRSYEKLLVHASKRLIYGHFERGGEYCALGVLYHDHNWDWGRALYALDCTGEELLALRDVNDQRTSKEETPEERYLRVLEWLKAEVAKGEMR